MVTKKTSGSFFSLAVFWILTGGFPLTVVLHEAGHLLGALLAGGFETVSIAIFPLTWRKTKEGWVVSRSWKKWYAESGRVVVQPITMESLRRRALLFVAGGPVASLLCALSLGVAIAGWWASEPEAPLARVFFVVCSGHFFLHAATFLLTSLPVKKMPGATMPTDGWNFSALARGNVLMLSQWASHVVVNQLRRGRRLTEVLDRKTLEAWARRESASGYLHFLLLLEAAGRGDRDRLRALVGQALGPRPKKKPRPYINRTADFLAFFIAIAALEDGNLDAARGALSRLQSFKGDVRPQLALSRAAIAAASKDAKTTRTALAELDKIVSEAPLPAALSEAYRWIRDSLERVPI